MEIDKKVDIKPPTPNLSQEERTYIAKIADGLADVTFDGRHRSGVWRLYLIDPFENEIENPYKG